MRFDPETHTYYADDGRILPSVTQVLTHAGLCGSGFYTPGSASRGSRVHLACEEFDRFGEILMDIDEEIRPYVEGYQYWRFKGDGKGWDPFKIEEQVEGEGYGGTVDRVYWRHAAPSVLVDLKTGAPAPWHRVQLAAYGLAMGLETVGALYLDKLGGAKLRIVSRAELEEARGGWARALGRWYEDHPDR